MPADHPPLLAVPHPDVGEKHAIVDLAAEIVDLPARVDGADHHFVEHGRVADVEVDRHRLALLDGLEPLVAAHRERAAGAGADQDEVGMDQRAKPVEIVRAQCVAPIALELADQVAGVRDHRFRVPAIVPPQADSMPHRNRRIAA